MAKKLSKEFIGFIGGLLFLVFFAWYCSYGMHRFLTKEFFWWSIPTLLSVLVGSALLAVASVAAIAFIAGYFTPRTWDLDK